MKVVFTPRLHPGSEASQRPDVSIRPPRGAKAAQTPTPGYDQRSLVLAIVTWMRRTTQTRGPPRKKRSRTLARFKNIKMLSKNNIPSRRVPCHHERYHRAGSQAGQLGQKQDDLKEMSFNNAAASKAQPVGPKETTAVSEAQQIGSDNNKEVTTPSSSAAANWASSDGQCY